MAELIVLGRTEEMQIKSVGKKSEPQHPTRDAQHLPRHLGSIHDDPTPNWRVDHSAIPADKHARRQVTLARERCMARERGLSGCPVASCSSAWRRARRRTLNPSHEKKYDKDYQDDADEPDAAVAVAVAVAAEAATEAAEQENDENDNED
jgi:hypothetical protein